MKTLIKSLRAFNAQYLGGPVIRALRGVSSDSFEVQYLDFCRTVLRKGVLQANRTGISAYTLPGASIRFDISNSFPAITTKKFFQKSVFGELCGFMRAARSAADFRQLGSKVWDANANKNEAWLASPWRDGEDELGPVYGVHWREYDAVKVLNLSRGRMGVGESQQNAKLQAALDKGYDEVTRFVDEAGDTQAVLRKKIDQLGDCLRTLVDNPHDRRILFHGWNPATLDEQALPVCHLLYQFLPNVESRELSIICFLRSNDLGLGLPFNSAEAAAMLELVARLTGFKAKWVTLMIGDAHIYENQVEMIEEQLCRIPKKAPRLSIADRVPAYAQTGILDTSWLAKVSPDDFVLEGYEHHPALTAAMAV